MLLDFQDEKGSKKTKRTSKQAKRSPKATEISGQGMEVTVGEVQYSTKIWVSGKESGPLSGRNGKSEREWDVPAAFAFGSETRAFGRGVSSLRMQEGTIEMGARRRLSEP
jgi:hypothetical protein